MTLSAGDSLLVYMRCWYTCFQHNQVSRTLEYCVLKVKRHQAGGMGSPSIDCFVHCINAELPQLQMGRCSCKRFHDFVVELVHMGIRNLHTNG